MNEPNKSIEDVELAEEGTLMAEFQKERTDAISEMFDNQLENGIYPTSRFFARLDKKVESLVQQSKEEVLQILKDEHAKTGKNCDKHPQGSQGCIKCFSSKDRKVLLGEILRKTKSL